MVECGDNMTCKCRILQESSWHLEEENENLEGQQPEQVRGQLHVHPSPSPLLPLECDHSLGSHTNISKADS